MLRRWITWVFDRRSRGFAFMALIVVVNFITQDEIIGWPRPLHIWLGITLAMVTAFMFGFFAALVYIRNEYEKGRGR